MKHFFSTLLSHKHSGATTPAWRLLVPVLQAILLTLLVGQAAYAQSKLQADVDRSSITLDETLTLNLRFGEQNLFGEPTFDALNKDFDVLSRNQSSKYQFINGRSESWVLWTLTLAPKRTGTLTIPAFEYEGEKSQAIDITVTQTPTVTNQSDQPVYLEVTLDKDTAYVQEQLLLTMKLFTSVDLNGLSSEDLAIDNALLKQVSEHQYQRTIDGKRYGVVEVSYAVFPQQSGELIIPSLVWTVAVQAPRNFAYDPYGRDPLASFRSQQSSKRLRLRSPEKHIKVLPQPQSTLGAPWLPAKDLMITQSWSQPPESFVVGEPITRTVEVKAKGLLAAQLPPLQLDTVNGIKYYPDQPQSDDQTSAQGVNASRRESFAIVPSKTGELVLPAIAVSWWDTEEGRLKEASLPAQTISVQAGQAQPSAAPLALPPQIQTAEPSTIIGADRDGAQTGNVSVLWQLLTAIGALTSALFAALWWRSQQALKTAQAPKTAAFQAAEVNGDAAAAFKALKQACKAAGAPNSHTRPVDVRSALLVWAKAALNADSLQAIVTCAPDELRPPLQLLLQRFDASLYSREQTQCLSAAEYQELVKRLEQLAKHQLQSHQTQAALAPLYPQ